MLLICKVARWMWPGKSFRHECDSGLPKGCFLHKRKGNVQSRRPLPRPRSLNGRRRAEALLPLGPVTFLSGRRGAYGRSVYRFFPYLGPASRLRSLYRHRIRGTCRRGLGLGALGLGLAGLLCGALAFVACRDGYGLFAWALLMLLAGGVACFGGACWLAARRRKGGEEPPTQDWWQR